MVFGARERIYFWRVEVLMVVYCKSGEDQLLTIRNSRSKQQMPGILSDQVTQSMNMDYPIICFKELVVHPSGQKVSINGASARLTKTEFSLLYFLVRHVGRTFTRREIIDAVKGENYPATDRTVDVQVNALRKKLGKYKGWIETVRGTGYRFQLELSAGLTKPSASEIAGSRQERSR